MICKPICENLKSSQPTIVDHWLTDAIHRPSPNCDSRLFDDDISLLVIHCISLPPGNFGGSAIDDLFLNQLNPNHDPYFQTICQLRVSAHVLIRRDGSSVQYVPFHLRAWHAGVSSYQGRERCNDFSIGIELEGTEQIPYTDAQYQQLVCVIRLLLAHYPGLDSKRIVGHSDIAPGRKTDPGDSFDWPRFHSLLTG